jgi:hypothetical protein
MQVEVIASTKSRDQWHDVLCLSSKMSLAVGSLESCSPSFDQSRIVSSRHARKWASSALTGTSKRVDKTLHDDYLSKYQSVSAFCLAFYSSTDGPSEDSGDAFCLAMHIQVSTRSRI